MGEETGVWIDNQYFSADINNGRIVIPYAKHPHLTKIILIHQNISQLVDFNRLSTNFRFSSAFILSLESLITGNLASIIIKPYLTLNGQKVPLKMLKNFMAIINTSSYVDDIPHSNTFQNLIPSEDRDLKLNFNIAPNLKDMNIIVKTEVYNETLKTTEEFSAHKSFKLDSHINNPEICCLFLKKLENIYFIEMFGKGGERKANYFIQISLKSKYLKYEVTETLESNLFGRVNLGELRGVYSVKGAVLIDSFPVCREWVIGETNYYMYPSVLNIIEGEEFEIPVNAGNIVSPLSPATTNILSLAPTNGETTNSHFSALKLLTSTDESRYNILKICNTLSEGKYITTRIYIYIYIVYPIVD